MRLNESGQPRGIGYLPLQDHRSKPDVDMRAGLLCMRVKGRKDSPGEFGDYVHEKVGDLNGAFVWTERDRPVPMWSFVTPSQTMIGTGETRTSESGSGASGSADAVASSGPAPDGSAAKPKPVPGGKPPRVFEVPSFGFGAPSFGFVGGGISGLPMPSSDPATAQFGGEALNPHSARDAAAPPHTGDEPAAVPRLTADGRLVTGSSGAEGGVKAWIKGDPDADDAAPTSIIPTTDGGWARDDRFASTRPDLPLGWPALPGRWHGLTVASTEEKRQRLYFHPTDPRIPLVHSGKYPSCGALVCDLKPGSNEPELTRHARLHGHLRILSSPSNSPDGRNAIAWNLTTAGKGDVRGGYVVDRGSVSEQVGRDVTISPGTGPFAGANSGLQPNSRLGGGQHINRGPGTIRVLRPTGKKSSALVVGMVSANDGGPLHVGGPGDKHRRGSTTDGFPIHPWHIQTGALFLNPDRPHEDGPLNLSPRFKPGGRFDYSTEVVFGWSAFAQKFDWQTWTPEEEPPYDEPPGDDPPPPIDPPEVPPTITPDDPNFPKPPPGAGTGQSPELGPGGPAGGGGGQPGLANAIKRNGKRPMRSVADGRKQGSSSPFYQGRMHTRRWLEMQTAAQSFRAQKWGEGMPDMIHSRAAGRTVEGPTVLRLDTYAKQSTGPGGGHSYTREPGNGPYCDGTADGGVWVTSPEHSGEDYGADFSLNSRSPSTPTFGIMEGAHLGFGLPDLPTGGVRTGTTFRPESGELALYTHDPAGVATKNRNMSVSSADSIIASVSQTQGDAAQTADHIHVGTCANAGDSITLPNVLPGSFHTVRNDGAESLDVFPASGESINAGVADAAASVASGATALAVYQSSGKWRLYSL